MKILVINSGSSSLKYQLFDMTTGDVLAKGLCERIGGEVGIITHKRPGFEPYKAEPVLPDHGAALSLVLGIITDKELGVIANIDEIKAVGHRVAHGGEMLKKSSLIGEKELEYLFAVCAAVTVAPFAKNGTPVAYCRRKNVYIPSFCYEYVPGLAPVAVVGNKHKGLYSLALFESTEYYGRVYYGAIYKRWQIFACRVCFYAHNPLRKSFYLVKVTKKKIYCIFA